MKILLADDEPMIRNLYHDMLEGNGHRVETVSDGREALDRLAESSFDLVIMDLHMPRLDGFTAMAEIRRKGLNIPILVMTGHYPDEEVEERISGLGVAEVLRKPVMITVLQRAVDRLGGQAR